MKPMHPRKRLRRLIKTLNEMIATAEWWNRNRTDAAPLDCEPERVMLKLARECEAIWDAGDTKAAEVKSGELARYAKRLVDGDAL